MNRKNIMIWALLMSCICVASAQNIIRPKIACPNGIYVNSYNGVLFYQRSDLQIPNRGMSLEAVFYYNSSANRINYGYGNGWSLGIEMRYLPDSTGIIIEQGDGRQDLYTRYGSQFVAPTGVFSTLTVVDNGYQLRTKDGTRYLFTDPISQRLTSVVDRNNNTLNLSYSNGHLTTISDDNGRALQFTWTDTLMTRMTTSFDTRSWSYQYDENGNLAHVTDAMQRTVHYGYNNDNRLCVFTDAAGYSTYVTYNKRGMAHRVRTDLTDKAIRYEMVLKQTVFVDYLTDGNNQFSTYYWDDQGRVIEKKGNCCGFSSKLEYDNDNNVVRLEDANGHATTYTYDHNGNMLSATDALGNTQYYTYESTYGNILTYTDKKGNVYHFSYDDRGNLTEMRTPLNTTTTFTYNNYGQVLTSTDANGNTTTYAYDNYGNLISQTDALGNTNTMTYNIAGNIISSKDPYQAETRMTYNNADELIRLVDPLGNTMQMSYDSRGAITAMTDAKQHVTHFTYDALRQPISITGPMNNTVTTTYNAKQKPTQMVDAMNNAVKRVYDDHDWLTYVVDVLGDTTWFSYDNTGQVIGVELPTEQLITYQYDALDRLVSVADQLGTMQTYAYDDNGNMISLTDAEGHTTVFQYDELNRLVQTTDAEDHSEYYSYDDNGNVLSYTDPLGNKSYYTYNAMNQVQTEQDALNNVTSFVYNANGRLASVTDARGSTTTYQYDANNQLTKITFDNGNTQQFAYDSNGNVVNFTDESGSQMSFVYDALDRLIHKTYPNNAVDVFTYDINGNMLTASNAEALVSFAYDNAGRVLSETLNNVTTSYSYDTKNRSVIKTYPNGRMITEEYDYRQRLVRVKENNNCFVALDYNNNDFLTQRTYGNGTTTNYYYNALNQLIRLTDNPNVANVQMTYDVMGNMLSKEDFLCPAKSEMYGYDALNRLTSFKQGQITTGVEIPNPLKQVQYNLDALGNRSTMTVNGVTTNYIADNMNAYTAVTGMNLQYDDNGNMTGDGTHTYQYNYNNRLISVDNGQTATYKYDALNRRVQKVVVDPVETTINYYYCGDQAIEERDANDEVLTTYVFGISVDDILQMQKDSNTYYYHKNHLGSVLALTDENGNLVERYEYDPFGQPSFFDINDSTLNQSLVSNNILFAGRNYDTETGSYYYRARTMNTILGRFMQCDPLMYVDGLNMYCYVNNNAISSIDPWGLYRIVVRDCPEDRSKGKMNPSIQDLYTADVELYDDNGNRLDSWENIASTYTDPIRDKDGNVSYDQDGQMQYYTLTPVTTNSYSPYYYTNQWGHKESTMWGLNLGQKRGQRGIGKLKNGNPRMINIHPGGENRRGSKGCITIIPNSKSKDNQALAFWNYFFKNPTKSKGVNGKIKTNKIGGSYYDFDEGTVEIYRDKKGCVNNNKCEIKNRK